MKIGKTKISARTLALLAATILLATSGGFLGTRAVLEFYSEDAVAGFELRHIQVHLMENDVDVCHENNNIFTVHRSNGKVSDSDTKNSKYKGNLVEYLGYTNDSPYSQEPAYKLGTPGKVEPGRTYKEEIKVRNKVIDPENKNAGSVDEYVRVIIRKYWVDENGNKDTRLDPALIKLTYGDKDYNSTAWTLNKKEHTTESDTYYLKSMLKGGDDSDLLFDSLTIDSSILDESNMKKETRENKDGNKITKVYTYSYDYDGYTFYIEADVQAIQTHNVNDAIASLWGVGNVSVSGQTVTVK